MCFSPCTNLIQKKTHAQITEELIFKTSTLALQRLDATEEKNRIVSSTISNIKNGLNEDESKQLIHTFILDVVVRVAQAQGFTAPSRGHQSSRTGAGCSPLPRLPRPALVDPGRERDKEMEGKVDQEAFNRHIRSKPVKQVRRNNSGEHMPVNTSSGHTEKKVGPISAIHCR